MFLNGVQHLDRVLQADILRRWPALTIDDIEIAGADGGLLAVRIVERYGISWEWAYREVSDWAVSLE